MDFEFAFKTLWGIATAAGWFWVNGIAGRLKTADERAEQLKEELHRVKLEYKTKAEAQADRDGIIRSLERIENKIDKLSDRKADKP